MFTFGIGSGVSTELVKGIARAGNGRAEFVYEGERMQRKVHIVNILTCLYVQTSIELLCSQILYTQKCLQQLRISWAFYKKSWWI